MRKLYFIGILLLLVVGLAACGDGGSTENDGDTSEEATATKSGGGETDTKEVASENLLEWETSDFEEAGNQVIPLKDGSLAEMATSEISFAHNGTFILGGNWENYFYDYMNGTMSNYDLNGFGDPQQSNDVGEWSYLYGKYFYTTNDENGNRDEKQIVEVNTETGEKQVLMTVDGGIHLVEKDRILYVSENDNFFAYDIANDEKIWEKEHDVNFSLIDIAATENGVVLLGDEGLAVYDQSSGEKRYEAEGFFEDIIADGEDFYVIETDEESLFELDNPIFNVYRYNQETEEGEKLFTTPEVNAPSEYREMELGIDTESLYVKTTYGVLAYDKNNADPLWTVTVGEGLVQEFDDVVTDDFQVAFNNGKVYTRTTIWGSTPGPETIFTVIDGKTGEMLENYALGYGETFGPVADEERVVLFKSDDTEGEWKPAFYVIP